MWNQKWSEWRLQHTSIRSSATQPAVCPLSAFPSQPLCWRRVKPEAWRCLIPSPKLCTSSCTLVKVINNQLTEHELSWQFLYNNIWSKIYLKCWMNNFSTAWQNLLTLNFIPMVRNWWYGICDGWYHYTAIETIHYLLLLVYSEIWFTNI